MYTEQPASRTPTVNKDYVIDHRGKKYVLYAGLLDAAHRMGLAGITTTLVQTPSKAAGIDHAICHATVTMPYGQFSGIGDAGGPNEQPRSVAALHPIRMAETRAKARALRDAINASEYQLEGQEDPVPQVDLDTGEITDRRLEVVPTASPEQMRASGRGPTLTVPQQKWNKLVQTLQQAGWTRDAKESVETGKPLIPEPSPDEYEDPSLLTQHGFKVQTEFLEWQKEQGKGEGDA